MGEGEAPWPVRELDRSDGGMERVRDVACAGGAGAEAAGGGADVAGAAGGSGTVGADARARARAAEAGADAAEAEARALGAEARGPGGAAGASVADADAGIGGDGAGLKPSVLEGRRGSDGGAHIAIEEGGAAGAAGEDAGAVVVTVPGCIWNEEEVDGRCGGWGATGRGREGLLGWACFFEDADDRETRKSAGLERRVLFGEPYDFRPVCVFLSVDSYFCEHPYTHSVISRVSAANRNQMTTRHGWSYWTTGATGATEQRRRRLSCAQLDLSVVHAPSPVPSSTPSLEVPISIHIGTHEPERELEPITQNTRSPATPPPGHTSLLLPFLALQRSRLLNPQTCWISGVGRVCRTEEDGEWRGTSGLVFRASYGLDLDTDADDVDEELSKR
ncbi:hypothetical protein GALMADRAFT_205339 [Galerina marginata CBS 339.88]|uniref:Uncharacterized protein n=1 Tax=Galerina marginata (strain CBS 339.88) TaxID=685588 RepID=A0A067U1L2_GALM3|nr:hypothetical protein GALMADRAFT_205339 [Galerina marginata CBS 339.88]